MLHPTVYNTSEVCSTYGVKHVVLSPGSRNAPLSISFARNDKIKKWVVPDERSAGFIALGIAQKLNQPVVLCCTSGTALLNYYPAITEAYYREIPLIVLSADRPPELIDQRDGQTIRQLDVMKNHVKSSFQLPIILDPQDEVNYETELVSSLQLALRLPRGPVHVNIPFEEPFYPDQDQKLTFKSIAKDTSEEVVVGMIDLRPELFRNRKVLIVIGQKQSNERLDEALEELQNNIPVIASVTSNVKIECIEHIDLFLGKQEELQPDVLITTGLSVLSKKLKNFIRTLKPATHLHFDPSGVPVDTYQTNPQIIKIDLEDFLEHYDLSEVDTSYIGQWKNFSQPTHQAIGQYFESKDFCELVAFKHILESIPHGIELHLSNSMPVRYAEILGVKNNPEIWCNRGTSGIDGATSTAVGTSLVSETQNVLITGDLAFLYDRNAFFHNYALPNLRIIVINNQGGGIFRLIDGPSELPELETYFETRHNRTAKYICEENDIEYRVANDLSGLSNSLKDFYEPSDQPRLIEVFTEPSVNQRIFKEFKQHVHERLS